MTPFFTEQEFVSGNDITQKLMTSFKDANVNAKAALIGVGVCVVAIADMINLPLESMFEFMRQMRKTLQAAHKAMRDAAPLLVTPEGTPAITTPDEGAK